MCLLSCGKKSPPYLPKSRLPFRVAFLEAEIKDGIVILTGKIVGKEKKGYRLSDIKGCKVYYSRYSPDNLPCEACPIYLTNIRNIKGKVVRDGDFYCKLPWMNKKGVYYIKVRLIGPGSAIGPLSNRTKVEVR